MSAGRAIPRWAWLCTVAGAVLMVPSGTTLIAGEALLARCDDGRQPYPGRRPDSRRVSDGRVPAPGRAGYVRGHGS